MAVSPSKEIGAVTLSPWGKAIAGAVAAVIANTIVYPLDLAKTRLQVQSDDPSDDDEKDKERYTSTADVIRKEFGKNGVTGLYTGLLGSLAGTVSTNFAYFYWYSFFRSLYIRKYARTGALTTATELLLGAVAGAVAQLFTIPVSVVTTRQQTEGKSFWDSAREILGQDGISGFWRGLKASLILVVNPSITYGSSSRLRTAFFGSKQHLTAAENFLLGAVSKSLATVATQPLIVAKVMQQSSYKFKSFADALVYLFKKEGVLGVFKGLGPQLSKGILVQGLLFAFKDKVEEYIIRLLIAVNTRKARVSIAL